MYLSKWLRWDDILSSHFLFKKIMYFHCETHQAESQLAKSQSKIEHDMLRSWIQVEPILIESTHLSPKWDSLKSNPNLKSLKIKANSWIWVLDFEAAFTKKYILLSQKIWIWIWINRAYSLGRDTHRELKALSRP